MLGSAPEPVLTWLKLSNMLIIQVQNVVRTVPSIYLLILSVVLAAIKDFVPKLKKRLAHINGLSQNIFLLYLAMIL